MRNRGLKQAESHQWWRRLAQVNGCRGGIPRAGRAQAQEDRSLETLQLQPQGAADTHSKTAAASPGCRDRWCARARVRTSTLLHTLRGHVAEGSAGVDRGYCPARTTSFNF